MRFKLKEEFKMEPTFIFAEKSYARTPEEESKSMNG
jgi:hypothetical protein